MGFDQSKHAERPVHIIKQYNDNWLIVQCKYSLVVSPIRFYIAQFEIINRTFCTNCRHVCTSGNILYFAEIKGFNVCFLFVLSHKTPQRIPGKITLLLCLKEIQYPFIAQYLVTPIPISHGTREM